MASAFLDHAHRVHFSTSNTRYNITGIALLSSGGQFCYAYDNVASLSGSRFWETCTSDKIFGCCPSNLTEDYYWRNPHEYVRHPPTLLVQSIMDNDADWDGPRFYHNEISSHGGLSTHFAVGGQNHPISPASYGVIASWVLNLFR
jgi:hypothetical protein|eukprot:COSAG02_NODE_7969_length_2766_cov_2.214098_3_plen_145_part_00